MPMGDEPVGRPSTKGFSAVGLAALIFAKKILFEYFSYGSVLFSDDVDTLLWLSSEAATVEVIDLVTGEG